MAGGVWVAFLWLFPLFPFHLFQVNAACGVGVFKEVSVRV